MGIDSEARYERAPWRPSQPLTPHMQSLWKSTKSACLCQVALRRTGRILVPTNRISRARLLPALIQTLVVRRLTHEKGQRLDEARAVGARAVVAGAMEGQEIGVAEVGAGVAAADLRTALGLCLAPVELGVGGDERWVEARGR
jgi:hypothetical protein